MSEGRFKDILIKALLIGGLFAGLFVFFYIIHPMIITDGDDWWYIYYSRKALPMRGIWNPAKVLPEILMPAASELAVWLIYPITGEYIRSMAMMHAIVLCAFIAAYVVIFRRLLASLAKGKDKNATILMSFFFLLLHFLIFRTKPGSNPHLFRARDLTYLFNYVIPTLLNFIIILEMERCDGREKEDRAMGMRRISVFVVLVYLALFSNLYSNVVIAVYAAVSLFIDFFRKKMTRGNRVACAVIMVLWGVSAIFELGGGRADQVGSFGNLRGKFALGWKYFYGLARKMNRMFLWLFVAAAVCGLILLLIKKERKRFLDEGGASAAKFIFCGAVTAIYLIMISGVTGAWKIGEAGVELAFYSFIIIAEVIVLSYIVRRTKVLKAALPLLLLITVFEINTSGRTFQEVNYWDISPETCIEIDNMIIDQFVEADRSGRNEVELHVIKSDDASNWPHATYAARRFSEALYKHGITRRKIKVKLVPDQALTDKYLK